MTYTLMGSSEAIDAGINVGVDYDYFGSPRPRGHGYDIGYQETSFASYYVITPTAGAGGTISPGAPQIATFGSSLTFTFAPDAQYHIQDVSVDGVSQGAVDHFTFSNIAADHSLHVSFALNTYTITPTAGANGSITPGTPQTVNAGSSITFTIAANSGYHIVDVGVDGVSQGVLSSYTFTNVTTNHTITSAYAIDTYTLTVATGGSGSGVVSPTVGVYTYPYGTIITPTAIANTGSTFAGWSGDCSGAGSCTIMMTGTKAITANFDIETVAYYTLTITTAGAGSGVVTPTIGAHTYPYGTVITITASANLYSYFSGWGGDCSGSTCVVTMTGDRGVIANFGQYRLCLPLVLKTF